MTPWWAWAGVAAAAAATAPWGIQRVMLSLAKHPSLAGHPRLARRISRWVPAYCFALEDAWGRDGAPPAVQAQRQYAFVSLGQRLRAAAPRTLALTEQAREGLPDLQLTGRYRVPFPFSALVREHLPVGAFWQRSEGVELIDLDGNRYYDLTGSYGVNLYGLDFYKTCMEQAEQMGRALGPVLGGYHPCVADNVERLRRLSGMDAVSFHMSGTEAVMQAVRLARYHTGRRYVVRFAGAYHGWWDDVQPGPGNPGTPRDTLTLADLSERTLRVLRRRRDIACVLVNPLQALHPNRAAPGDSTLVLARSGEGVSRAAYADWLRRLREVCSAAGIALIFDEVFLGFRLAPGGAQAYFGVPADLVCYGKTLGGGLPIGVVCGRAHWMRRYRDDRPADLVFARGTFNAHPYVMAAMNVFLRRLEAPEIAADTQEADAYWATWLQRFNTALQQAAVPVRVRGLSSVWTVDYPQVGRYHWLLQYYLREAGLALSWVGTGRLIFSHNYRDEEMAAVLQRLLQACRRMTADGWWWRDPALTDDIWRQRLRRALAKEMARAWWQRAAAF
ncbi:aminotransferase class III-fold pyridoxal phosphate-dependent enzyme [Tepidimonas sp.]|uniref:aminotransferase class III-fold pyridoxal phosphate-dependent enzyme n=1 Tax=Tepidimonas sp. TaxID=2002775 RepID=UPI002FE12F4C